MPNRINGKNKDANEKKYPFTGEIKGVAQVNR